jgi:hypothetical protein
MTMNKPQSLGRKITASLVCTALLMAAGSASADLTITTNNQNSASTFTPTWPVANNSLIAGLSPSASFGNFTQESAGGLATLTDEAIGPVLASGNQTAMATCGNNGGRMVIYDLPASANGYDITNISTYSGWGNGGRHAQAYTLYYSTQAAPRKFISLGSIAYTGGFTGNNPNQPSANQVIWSDSNNGSIAANVSAIMFNFNSPVAPNGENGYSGYSEITVQGTPSATVVTQVVTIAMSNTNGAAPFNPGWTLETPSLIAGRAPFSTTGSFDLESPTLTGIRDINSLTANGDLTLNPDMIAANNNNTTTPNYVTCGGNACTSIIYALTNSPNGSDVTNIVVYNGWADNGRDGQYYTVLYSTVAQPTTYLPISTVYYLPNVPGSTPSANRVAIASTNGVPLASAVANLKFDFGSVPAAGAFNNGFQGYGQIIVQGNDTTVPPPPPSPYLTQDTLPTHAETFVGDQVVFTAVYSNAPPADVQWLVIKGGVTNILSGATNGTLTLNNVQTTDSGSYLLMAVNATNGAAAPSYSTAAPLVVSAATSVGNVVVRNSGQTGPSTFYPPWTINTNLDLIFGSPTDGSGSPGTAAAGSGSYGNQTGLAGDPTVLADGNLGSTLPNMVSCGWVNVGAGQSMTYTLPTQTYGYNITNITIYGGWPDDGRNEQKYQVLYSTVTDPTTFVSIGTFDYNPTFTSSEPNATRVTLVPAVGALAQNVYALEINFNLQSKNNWNGYSEITVNGNPSTGFIPSLTQDITPNTAEDVKGNSLNMSANFSGATSFQWQKNGTNIPGAIAPTLTLNNLQLSDTATNGGYRLLGINAAGTNTSRGCSVIVDPVPAATNNVVTAFAYQSSDAAAPNTFGPTWDTTGLGSSLIAYAYPVTYDTVGNFYDPDNNFPNSAGGLPVLTDGNYGVFAFDGSHPAFATAGPTAGQYVVYTLGYDPNGYDVTNIQIAGGWNDNGRNSQFYTVSYSTVQNPTLFTTLNAVSISPTFPSENVIRTTMTPATGVLASNVYAIEINFLYPQGVPNGYSGYSEISVFGSASANPPPTGGPVITAENELGTNNIWTVETPNLIANQLPSSTGPGMFTEEGCNETNLTDGVIGFGFQYGASCGADGAAVPWIIFNSASGWDLTNIVVYSLWNDYGRDGQFYNLSYSTLSAPTTFVPLASVSYNPDVPTDGTASGNRVAISPAPGQTLLASNVYAVKFDFTPQGTEDFGWSGYSEIVLQGSNLAPVTIATFNTPTISGGNLILSGTGGTPNYSYTVLTTTNLLTPLADWTVSTNGTTDGTGAYSTAIPVSAAPGGSFYQLRMP